MKEKLLKRKGIRRVLSFVLCLAMCVSLIPVTAMAAGLSVENITWNDTVLSCEILL